LVGVHCDGTIATGTRGRLRMVDGLRRAAKGAKNANRAI